MENLTPEEQRLLQAELSTGESVLWTGKPSTKVVFHSSDIFQVPFSLLWGGFALFWEYGASGLSKGQLEVSFFTLWGLPFIVIGQYMIWGRFVYEWWKKQRIVYVVTSERLLAIVRPPYQKSIAMFYRNVHGIDKAIRSDGIGTLKFGSTRPNTYKGNWSSLANLFLDSLTPVFVDIENAAEVAEIVNKQLRKFNMETPLPQA